MVNEDLRLKCLELAVSKTADFRDAVERAKAYFAFVTEKDKVAEATEKVAEQVPKEPVSKNPKTSKTS